MAQAKKGDMVQTDYLGKLDDGTIFDSSKERGPLEFTIGAGQLLPGFEQGVIGMNEGETKTVKIPAVEAYGLHREDMILTVDRSDFPPDVDPKVGEQLDVHQPDGSVNVVVVTKISEAGVILDANHPLAGKDLTFDIRLLKIRTGPVLPGI